MQHNFHTHTDPKTLDYTPGLLYFSPAYLAQQPYENLLYFESANILFPTASKNGEAISLPRSPFGSFFLKEPTTKDEFTRFLKQTIDALKALKHTSLVVCHPGNIYQSFISPEWMQENGFSLEYEELNQHIDLQNDWEIHKMQERKLKSLREEGFEFKKIAISELETIHQFIAACRQVQGLDINIPLDLLQQLSDATQAYDFFGVYRGDKLSSVCITVRVTKEVAYYYLPATAPTFRSESPMVMLIEGMINYYKNVGVKYFDLGVSSIKGKTQESLRVFKERMGATETRKSVYSIKI